MNTQVIKEELDAVEAEYAALLIDINRVSHHIDEETLLEQDGGDKDWLVRARHARRKLAETQTLLKPKLNRLRKAYEMALAADARSEEKKRKASEHAEHQRQMAAELMKKIPTNETELLEQRMFIMLAKQCLPMDTYLGIWAQVKQEVAR